jgi:hypothetical protein
MEEIMKSIRNLMLGMAVLAGAASLGAAKAEAAVVRFGVAVGAPVAVVPPCPGAGYFWVAPYQVAGVWYPGRWEFRGVRGPVFVDRFHGGFYGRGFYRDRFRR